MKKKDNFKIRKNKLILNNYENLDLVNTKTNNNVVF